MSCLRHVGGAYGGGCGFLFSLRKVFRSHWIINHTIIVKEIPARVTSKNNTSINNSLLEKKEIHVSYQSMDEFTEHILKRYLVQYLCYSIREYTGVQATSLNLLAEFYIKYLDLLARRTLCNSRRRSSTVGIEDLEQVLDQLYISKNEMIKVAVESGLCPVQHASRALSLIKGTSRS